MQRLKIFEIAFSYLARNMHSDKRKGKIGIFDSGLGGLLIMRGIVKSLAEYDYVYLGDTARVPYGNRSKRTIYQFTEEAVRYLSGKGCELIIVACNAASAQALRKIQRSFLPRWHRSVRVLGVVVPTLEEVFDIKGSRIGVLATQGTVDSSVFTKELRKINPKAKIFEQSAPLLVPLIEHDGLRWSGPILRFYIDPLLKKRIDTLVLGCTHYPVLKHTIRNMVGKGVRVISQDEIIPKKLNEYLVRHPEIEKRLHRNRGRTFIVSDMTDHFRNRARKWFGNHVTLKMVKYY